MSSTSALLAALRLEIASVRTLAISVTADDILYSFIGDFVRFGCKVTGSTASPQDYVVNLEGQATGDETNANPDASLSPTVGYQYPNIASTKGVAFRSTDLTATVENPPATGLGRYDIAYIYVGTAGAGFAIATGTPGAGVKSDFDLNGLDSSAYGEAAIADPVLPTGATPVARIYVEDVYSGIQQARIADIRNLSNYTGLAAIAAAAAEAAQTAAEAALDEFTDLYLGAHATEPTTDNDGDPLVAGAMFYDSTQGVLKVWDTTASPNAWRADAALAEAAQAAAEAAAATAAAQAVAAAASAAAASASASAASASASAASASETAAGVSAAAAAASYDSFDDRYLGAKTADPTLDNDGNALLTGAMYWYSTGGYMKVYDGAAWQQASYLPGGSYLPIGGGTLTGPLGIGTAASAGTTVRIGYNMTGSVSSYGILNSATVQSGVTSDATMYRSTPSTAAASFTLGSLIGFGATQGTIGAGSAVTNQYGYYAESNITGATFNAAYVSAIASASGRWNLYMSGTASNYLAGRLGIGTTTLTAATFANAATISGAIDSFGAYFTGTVQSTVTASCTYYRAVGSTQAAAFTLPYMVYFQCQQGTIGASSVVSNQVGFWAESGLTGATTNYGFYGGIAASGTARWNLYMAGSAPNYLAGNLGIGNSGLTSVNLNVGAAITGATSSYAVSLGGTIQSGVTNAGYYIAVSAGTAAASFTINTIQMFTAGFSSLGAGSAVTNLYGFSAESNITAGTNNFCFYGNVSSASGRWNLYMAGTASNYLAGRLGIGSTSLSDSSLRVDLNMTGATTAYHVLVTGYVQSDVTTAANYIRADLNTQTAAFTVNTARMFYATSQSLGAGSAVTNLYGFVAESTLTTGGSNYGFYGAIASGSNRYNIYIAGTATCYFASDMAFDKTITGGGTTGAQTINKNAGSVNFAAAATSLVVTNSRVTANSVIIATIATNDATAAGLKVVAGSGSFTIYLATAPTAETRVNFLVIN